jgi:hypothetical protein
MDEAMTPKFAASLKIVLKKLPEIQVLWKIKTSGGFGSFIARRNDRGFSLQRLSWGHAAGNFE